jgi:hypothetical protein
MNELFNNPEVESEMMQKFETLFDSGKPNITQKAVDLYLTIVEDHGIELDMDAIINLAEEYDIELHNFEEEVDKNM